jgi:adenine deaminase
MKSSTEPKKAKIKNIKEISGNIVDVLNNRIFSGTVEVKNGKISKITENNKTYDTYILPGFVDSHIHIESSMLIPSEFARTAVTRGMIGVVADPHEIANVVGIKGIDFMIENGAKVPFKFYFGAPSCVPATPFETTGAKISAKDIEKLIKCENIKCLGEMMDFPGVLSSNKETLEKIRVSLENQKPVDGHAPGLSGEDLKKYIKAGISTDHEAYSEKEADEKIQLGMKILIREGSAAKDFDALSPLIEKYPDFCMFSSDDKHPNDLVAGHIDLLVKRAIKLGYDKLKVLKCACINPVKHYKLDIGLLQQGDNADFIEIDSFDSMKVLKTVINGKIVFSDGWSLIPKVRNKAINNFQTKCKKLKDFEIKNEGGKIKVIKASNGQLITKKIVVEPKVENNKVVSDVSRDILKIAVINRYNNVKPAIGFINGFEFKKGAIASSVAHDSHNIIAVGISDNEIKKAVNLVIKNKGGLAVVHDDIQKILPLPVAGLMTNKGAFNVAARYIELEEETKKMGTKMTDPFMTMSFMALLVIPELKLSDKGLFDGKTFKFVSLFEKS